MKLRADFHTLHDVFRRQRLHEDDVRAPLIKDCIHGDYRPRFWPWLFLNKEEISPNAGRLRSLRSILTSKYFRRGSKYQRLQRQTDLRREEMGCLIVLQAITSEYISSAGRLTTTVKFFYKFFGVFKQTARRKNTR